MVIRRQKISANIGYVIYFLMLIFYIIQYSALPIVIQQKWLLGIVIVLSLMRFLIQRTYNLRYLCVTSVFICLSLFPAYQSHDFTPLIFAIMLFSAEQLKLDIISKISFLSILISMIILFMLSNVGVIIDYQYLREGQLRHSFGTAQPTIFSALSFFSVASFIYWKRNNLHVYHYIILSIIALLVYRYTASRNDTISILLLLCVPMIIKLMKYRITGSIIKFLILMSYPINALITYILSKLYSHNYGMYYGLDLNNILSGRLYLGNLALQIYPIKFWGQPIFQNGNGRGKQFDITQYFYIDSSYLYILLKFGLFFFSLLICWIVWRTYILIRNKLYFLAIVISIVGFECAWQLTLFTYLNVFLLCLVINISCGEAKSNIYVRNKIILT